MRCALCGSTTTEPRAINFQVTARWEEIPHLAFPFGSAMTLVTLREVCSTCLLMLRDRLQGEVTGMMQDLPREQFLEAFRKVDEAV